MSTRTNGRKAVGAVERGAWAQALSARPATIGSDTLDPTLRTLRLSKAVLRGSPPARRSPRPSHPTACPPRTSSRASRVTRAVMVSGGVTQCRRVSRIRTRCPRSPQTPRRQRWRRGSATRSCLNSKDGAAWRASYAGCSKGGGQPFQFNSNALESTMGSIV